MPCANKEEQKEKEEMHLGHRRPCISSLHSATIKRKLICGSPALPFPLAPSPDRRSQKLTDAHTHTHTLGNSVHLPFGAIIFSPKLQVHPHRAHSAASCRHTIYTTTTNTPFSRVYVRLFNLFLKTLQSYKSILLETLNYHSHFR